MLGLALGVTQILGFLDTNMLVCPTRICGVGGLSQCKDPTRMVLRHSGIYVLECSLNTVVFRVQISDATA